MTFQTYSHIPCFLCLWLEMQWTVYSRRTEALLTSLDNTGARRPFLTFWLWDPRFETCSQCIHQSCDKFLPFFLPFFSFHQHILSISYVQGLVPNSGLVDSEENTVKWLLTGMCTEYLARAIQAFVQELLSEQLLCWIRDTEVKQNEILFV